MTIRDLWEKASALHGTRPCLGFVDEEFWTFQDVSARVKRLCAVFRSWGLSEGDKVALYSANQPGWGVSYLSVVTSSLVAVPVLPDFNPREVAHVVDHSESKVLIIGRSLLENWERWVSDPSTEKPQSIRQLRVVVLEDLVSTNEADTFESEPFRAPLEEDLAAIIYTSGTTGASKGVMLTHRNIASNATTACKRSRLEPGDRMLSVLPLAHTYECTLGFLIPLWEGASVAYLSKPASPAVLLPALASIRPQAMLTVPLFIEKIYRQKILPGLNHGLLRILRKIPGLGYLLMRIAGRKLKATFGGRLKFFGIGGAPLAPEVERFLRLVRFKYAIGYGLTETSPLIAGSLEGHVYSTGPLLEGVEVRIGDVRNEKGSGEILVRGPNVMKGYFKDPEKTAEVLTPDGWFHTGDLGIFDRFGHLHIRGRSKNLILGPNGENIYPEAIEALINQNQLVVESLVLQREREIVAKVVLNYDALKIWAARHGKEIADLGHDLSHFAEDALKTLRGEINHKLNRFSRLSAVEEQKMPFEKTATLKIKRYLYC